MRITHVQSADRSSKKLTPMKSFDAKASVWLGSECGRQEAMFGEDLVDRTLS